MYVETCMLYIPNALGPSKAKQPSETTHVVYYDVVHGKRIQSTGFLDTESSNSYLLVRKRGALTPQHLVSLLHSSCAKGTLPTQPPYSATLTCLSPRRTLGTFMVGA